MKILNNISKRIYMPKSVIIATALVLLVAIVFAVSFAWELAQGMVNAWHKQDNIEKRGFAMGIALEPPDPTNEASVATYKELGEYADIALIQEPVAWDEYVKWKGQDTVQTFRLRAKAAVARKHGLKICLVLDPLNATDHANPNFPESFKNKDFGSEEIVKIYQTLTLKLAKDIEPEYFGLATEINTYHTLNARDFDNFRRLYRGAYQDIKDVLPDTKVFVTWQYEDLQGLWWWDELHDGVDQTNLVKGFEEFLDIFAISTYPSLVFESAREIPADYYARSKKMSKKPLAIVESGWSSADSANGFFVGSESDQALYVALMPQYTKDVKLLLWTYKFMFDIDIESYKPVFAQSQMDPDIMKIFSTMGLKDIDGEDKSAFRNWHNTYTNEQGRNL